MKRVHMLQEKSPKKKEFLLDILLAQHCKQRDKLNQQQLFFDKNSVVVIIFCDHGSRYMSKIYSDRWMKEQGFFDANHLQDETAIEYIK